ncbi:MAG: thioredoxin domain-containing protein [Parcubacteria group bacterium]
MKRSLGTIASIVVTLGIVGVGIWYLATRDKTAPVSATLWTRGSTQATTTLLEYSDFQCPACKVYQQAVTEILNEFGDKLRFEYRHFPLPNHRNSGLAAFAAEAAGKQNKFFEMADKLFEKQADWSESSDARDQFISMARELGLNEDQFKQDIDSQTTKDEIEADLAAGKVDGVNATPSFFINDAKIEPPKDIETFKQVVRQALGL